MQVWATRDVRLSIERSLARGYVETINKYSLSESEGYLALFHGRKGANLL